MLNLSLAKIVPFFTKYGYWVIFPVATVEGPVISAVAGFLSASGVFNPFVAYLVLCASDLLGDLIYYFIGYFGRLTIVEKYGHKFRLPKARVVRLEQNFHKHTGKLLVFGKTQPYGSII